MRLALYQGPSPSGDTATAFANIKRALAASAAMGAEMCVFPEAYLPGYLTTPMVAQPIDGTWAQRLGNMARAAGIGLVVGMTEQDGDHSYNTALAIGSQGETLASYRKIQLWEARERTVWSPGERYVTFDYRGRKIGLLICYDLEFPEHVRALVRAGADLVIVPTANPEPFDNVNRYAVTARAMENAISVAYCNYCGEEGEATYCGKSVIAGPEGEPLAMAGTAETLLVTDLPAPGDAMDRPTEHVADLRQIPALS